MRTLTLALLGSSLTLFAGTLPFPPLAGGPFAVTLTGSTSCTSASITVTDPSSCSLGSSSALAGAQERLDPGEADLDMVLMASSAAGDSASASGTETVTGNTEGVGGPGFLRLFLGATGSTCTLNLSVGSVSFSRSCGQPTLIQTIPIKLGRDEITFTLTGSVVSNGTGPQLTAVHVDMQVFGADGVTPALFAPEPGAAVLFALGSCVLFAIAVLRKNTIAR